MLLIQSVLFDKLVIQVASLFKCFEECELFALELVIAAVLIVIEPNAFYLKENIMILNFMITYADIPFRLKFSENLFVFRFNPRNAVGHDVFVLIVDHR